MTLLRDSYTSGLYLFGILKVVRGNLVEKAFWTVSMVLIILFTSYMVYRNAERYASYDSKTKIWKEKTQERALPDITIYMQSSYLRNVFCYNNKPLSNFLKSCDKTEPDKHKMQIYNGSDYIEPNLVTTVTS